MSYSLKRVWLALVIIWLMSYQSQAQTVIFQCGFESGDPTMTYATDGGSGICSNVTAAPRTGSNNGRLINAGSAGSIITPLITFTAGKYYTVEVYSKATKCVQSISICKSLTATNTAMGAATGSDIILNGSNNITTTTYTRYASTFLGVSETKYVGFKMINGSCGGPGTSTQDLDDIRIIENDYPPCTYYCTTGYATALTSYISEVGFNTISSISGWGGYICTGAQTSVQKTLSYNLLVGYHNATITQKHVAAWIDFNQNGSFADPGEQVLNPTDITTAVAPKDSSASVTVTIPAGAVTGVTKLRVGMVIGAAGLAIPCSPNTVQSDYEDYDIDINPAPVPMSYVSSTCTQANVSAVNAGTFNNEILSIQIVTTGTLSPLTASSFTFNTSGTTNAVNDISNARLWYTSNSSVFATGTPAGAVIANPNGGFIINTNVTLLQGTNYFWLTYDVPGNATSPDVIDASCTSITVGSSYTPTVSAPAGNRPLVTASAMTYVSCTSTQNISRTPRPDVNHQILGVEIVTSGAASPFAATSFTFNTNGTTAPATTNIANARLWSTGSSSTFATTTQVGSVVVSPNGTFTINGSVTLVNGTNYFWLTYDIPLGAACNPAAADAECTSITINSIARTPTITAPSGTVVIDCGTAYFSNGSNAPNLLSSWNTKRDGSGTAPLSFNAAYSFYVQSGHTMTTTASVTIPILTLEPGSYVRANHLITCTDLRINAYGTFEQAVLASSGAYITNFYIENYGTWIHNNAGWLPNGNRFFSPRSNQWFYQWGGGTFPQSTVWGNVLLNGTTAGNFDMSGVLTSIQGDFEWRRIGNSNYLQDGANETINIGGDLIFSGGSWKIAYDNSVPGNGTRIVTLNVTGNLKMQSGLIEDYIRGDNASATILNLGGNVNISGGTFNFNKSPGGATQFNLINGNSNVTWEQSGGTVTLGNTNIKSGKTVSLLGSSISNVAASRTFTVETGGKLYCSNYPVSGSGNFTLQTGALIGIGSAAGITSSGATGNIQVSGTRSYNSGASYEYYEGLTPQSTGLFTTTTTSATYPVQATNLIINKNNLSDVVNLTSTTDVTGTLTLTKGVLKTSYTAATAPWVRIPAAATVSPAGGSSASFVDGYIRRQGATAFTFPIGNASKWARLAITAPSVSTEFEARFVAAPYSNTTTMSATPATVLTHVSKVEHWFLTKPLGADAATTKAQLFWENAAASGIYKFDSLAVGRWSGTGWENSNCYTGCPANWTSSTAARTYTGAASGAVTGTIQSNTLSSFGPFTFASIGSTPANPLPVSLLGFRSTCEHDQVKLMWETASERNNDHFELEGSLDGKYFTIIQQIEGAGNSNVFKSYELSLNFKTYPFKYYRLYQTDLDGTKTLLQTIYSGCTSRLTNYVQVFENQSEQLVFYALSDQEGELKYLIYSASGALVDEGHFATTLGFTKKEVDAASWKSGLYFVHIQRQGENSIYKVFVD